MWNLLAGYSGLISLGQQAFVGLGGYSLAVFSIYYGLPIWASILIGGIVSVLFALLISAPIFRMRGVYFAIGTWTVAETLRILFSNWKYVGYGMGFFVKPAYRSPSTPSSMRGFSRGSAQWPSSISSCAQSSAWASWPCGMTKLPPRRLG